MSGRPDHERIEALYAEMRRLMADGSWDKESFLRLSEEMGKASGGHFDFLGTLLANAEDDWFSPEDRAEAVLDSVGGISWPGKARAAS